MQDSTSNQHHTRDDAAPREGLDDRIVQPEGSATETWYQSLCLGDPRYDMNQQGAVAQDSPATADQRQYYAADNAREPNAGAGYLTAPGELLQDRFSIPPAHRQSGGQHAQTSYPAQYSQPYYQPLEYQHGLSNNLFEQQRFYQPTESVVQTADHNLVLQQQQHQAAPTNFRNSSRIRKMKRRSGRSIPPPLSDPRWNIWTLGNLNIRHTNGGVTVKHLQQVLYDMDGNKRTKYDYRGLMKLIVDRRISAKRMAPTGWNPEQGWWVHFDL